VETRASHVVVGAFTLGVFAIALTFVLWLGKLRIAGEWDHYDVVFEEAVTGLLVGGAVQYGGIQVGEVRKLTLDQEDPSRVIARIRVAHGTPVKVDTIAKLALTGLTGVTVIQLSGGTKEAPMLGAGPGEEVPRLVASPSSLQKLLVSSEGVFVSVQDVLIRLGAALSTENLDNISATLDHVEKFTRGLSDHEDEIGEAIEDLAAASKALKRTLQRTDRLVEKLDKVAGSADKVLNEDAKKTLESARRLADSATSLIEQNRKAISSFANEDLRDVTLTLRELRAAVRALRELSEMLREDPQSLLRGKKETPREYAPR